MYQYLYTFKYDYHYSDLSQLEARQVFGKEVKDKLLFSNLKVDPSISPFIKTRLKLISSAQSYEKLLENIQLENIHVEAFKAEYLILTDDSTPYSERRKKLNDIGHCIEGEPDFEHPTITYAICNYKGFWYFGQLVKHNSDWHKHREKPCSFSNSINMNIAKTLVSIASKENKELSLLDACCGVGTIMLEACIAGFKIEGCDINWKACRNTRQNLAYFNYSAEVYRSDIKDLNLMYDAGIIDLPYNLTTYSDDEITANIIASSAKIASRIVIVSIADICGIITEAGLIIIDYCTVEKSGKGNFARRIWVCESQLRKA